MTDRWIAGTTEWTEYSIKLALRITAKKITMGFFIAGTGRAWVDDIQLLIDGRPISDLSGMSNT